MKFILKNQNRFLSALYLALIIFPFILSINNKDYNFFEIFLDIFGIVGIQYLYVLFLSLYLASASCKPLPYSQGYGGWSFCGNNNYAYDLTWIGVFFAIFICIFLVIPPCQRLLCKVKYLRQGSN